MNAFYPLHRPQLHPNNNYPHNPPTTPLTTPPTTPPHYTPTIPTTPHTNTLRISDPRMLSILFIDANLDDVMYNVFTGDGGTGLFTQFSVCDPLVSDYVYSVCR